MTAQTQTKVFYSPVTLQVVDYVHPVTGRGAYSNKSIFELDLGYPDVEVCEEMEAVQRIDEGSITDPVEIEQDDFTWFLECLPPLSWTNYGHTESFKMSEFKTGNVTQITARIGTRYFKFNGMCNMLHENIIKKIKKQFPDV